MKLPRLLVLGGLIVGTSALLLGETLQPGVIWLEGEAATRHNFPPLQENPFRPLEFWESDLLSEGAWIGMLWRAGEPQPYLEYDFEVTEPGTYGLYSRKFFSYGNFRWRIDEGDWIGPTVNALHYPLHTVSMREAGERISLSWFYMGEVELTPGPHTLRLEPVRSAIEPTTSVGVGTPLGYDVLLLTREPFFPAGKLRPGKAYPRSGRGAFPFQPGLDPFSASALDFRSLNEPFAGAQGGIVVRDGQLAYRQGTEPLRMVGVNYELRRLVAPSVWEYLARSLAKRGINFLRFDIGPAVSFDRNEGGALQATVCPVVLEQMSQLCSALKAQGIYTALTWDVENTRGFREAFPPVPLPDATPAADPPLPDISPLPALAGIVVFDPEVQEICQKVWQEILNLPLEDGRKLGHDPALFLITLAQQASLLEENALPWSEMPPTAEKSLTQSWRKWKQTRTLPSLPAWEDPSAEQEPFPEIRHILRRQDVLARHALRFLLEKQKENYKAQIRRLREFGYQGLISCSNQSMDFPEILGFAEIWSRTPGDVIERHGNFFGEFVPKFDIWNFSESALYLDRSVVGLDPLPGLEEARYDLPFRALSYDGFPSIATEVGVALPNRFSGEVPLVAFTLASLQGVQALGLTPLKSESWHGSLSSDRLQIFTPGLLGQMPALAFAFRQGLLPGPVVIGKLDVSEETITSLQPTPIYEAPHTQLNAPQRAIKQVETEWPVNPAMWLSGAISVRLAAPQDRWETLEPNVASPNKGIAAAEGMVQWDPERRILLVNAPKFQAASGALQENSPIRLGALELNVASDNATVCAVALDDQPLSFSHRILVQVSTEEFNTGFHAQLVGPLNIIHSQGRPPLLTKAVTGSVTFLRPDAGELVATALDAHGNPLLPAGLGTTLQLLPTTFYYLIEK